MKAVQIKNYSTEINTFLNDITKLQISDSELLIKVKAAAVNPIELLIMIRNIKLIMDYVKPLKLGNECSGDVEKVANKTDGFKKGDRIYTYLPIKTTVIKSEVLIRQLTATIG